MTSDLDRRNTEDFERLEHKVDKVEEEVLKLSIKLSEDHSGHHDYIRTVMQREARREALHRAVVEKTLVALLWSALAALGTLLYNVFMNHWH